MNLFEIIKNAPETSQLITDSIVITHSKLQQYNKILCSVSGGSDSDILIDLCQKLENDGFLKKYENRYILTRKGLFLGNSVFEKFL